MANQYPGPPKDFDTGSAQPPQPIAAPPISAIPSSAPRDKPPTSSRKRQKPRVRLGLILFLVVCAIAGGIYLFSHQSSPATGTDISGLWSVKLTGTAESFDGSMNLQQSGTQVSGTATFVGFTDPITGSVSGNNVTLDFGDASGTLYLSGTIADTKDMSGTFTTSTGAGSATWSATKVS